MCAIKIYAEPVVIHEKNNPQHANEQRNEWHLNCLGLDVNGGHVDLLQGKPIQPVGDPAIPAVNQHNARLEVNGREKVHLPG